MSADPWLTIVGLGEDGPDGLGAASRAALDAAEAVFGGPRHLALAGAGTRGHPWPVPFDIAPVLALRGRPVAVLASGDPFWHGAGSALAAALAPDEWRAFPAASTFSLAAARLGWRLEDTTCLGLHAAPFPRLLPVLAPGRRIVCLLRDAAAPAALARWLTDRGFGASHLHVLEALGGPRERVRPTTAAGFSLTGIAAPAAVAIEPRGDGLAQTPGRPDALFRHDGQITKAPVRALTLAALAPRAGERLWDLGAGSGAISVEWCLAAPATRAEAVEIRPDRAASIRANAEAFGLGDRVHTHEADTAALIGHLPPPDAVFLGGGADAALLARIWDRLPAGARLVANAVTLETQALVTDHAARLGGTLTRIALAEAAPLGPGRVWRPALPLVQWSTRK